MKESIPLETCHVISLNQCAVSNKLDIIPADPQSIVLTTSTTSLTMPDIDADAIHHEQLITDPLIVTPVSENLDEEFLPVDEENDTVNASVDDEDESTTTTGSFHSRILAGAEKYFLMSCPICLQAAVLLSSSCCTFECCVSCWCSHISATLNDGRIKIPCMSNDCNKCLRRESIMNFMRHDSVLHDRYLKLYANANQSPRAKTCPRCSHLYSLDEINPMVLTKTDKKSKDKINTKKIPKQVQCSECSLVWCFRCSAPWHENFTCKQFIKGDKLLLKWVNQENDDQRNARKCPKCSTFIQRNGGCPHMTCSSCACEFCYLCGRRYCKIPFIGQHGSKFSVFGCPKNLHPNKPWLRRTIRGTIATGVVIASPIVAVGAVTAAVTILPTVGIYRLVKRARARRRAHQLIVSALVRDYSTEDEDTGHAHFDPHLDMNAEVARYRAELEEELPMHDDFDPELDGIAEMAHYRALLEERVANYANEIFPLAIFADMDVVGLVLDNA
ncbi:unnamed protein product [Adineta steineri]|uniref:RBR-type E3 ubiquitin transferase n=1 Tax=Adineta steineri TaxID=433720 RepID=A0A819CLD5_9BILA|nr:unnamed protein product [Adineta steineri]